MLLDKPMTADEILETYAGSYIRKMYGSTYPTSEWAKHDLHFKVGKGTAELHTSNGEGFRTVYSVHVHRNHRGKGHGKRLMDAIVAYAEATGTGLYLTVLVDNEPALRLYTSVGFRVKWTERGMHGMERYPSKIPSTPEWDKHFEQKAIRLERDHEPRLGTDEGVAFMTAFHDIQFSDEHQAATADRARYTSSTNYEENTRRISCDDLLARMRAAGWTITRPNPSNTNE